MQLTEGVQTLKFLPLCRELSVLVSGFLYFFWNGFVSNKFCRSDSAFKDNEDLCYYKGKSDD